MYSENSRLFDNINPGTLHLLMRKAFSMREVLETLGFPYTNNTRELLRKKMRECNIPKPKYIKGPPIIYPDAEIFIINPPVTF